MKEKISTAISALKAQGHTVGAQIRGDQGILWYEIDGRMLASGDEMRNLADGLYSLDELEDLFKSRRAHEIHP
jgi:hypothetical protein